MNIIKGIKMDDTKLKEELNEKFASLSNEMYLRGFSDCCSLFKKSVNTMFKTGKSLNLTMSQFKDLIESIEKVCGLPKCSKK